MIVPAFTCVAVPNAILYTGATPVYVDIDEATYTADPAAVASAMSPRTRVVLAQNTFGLSADLDALSAVARPHGAVVVDDCTHGLGGTLQRPAERRGGARGVLLDAVEQADLHRAGGIAVDDGRRARRASSRRSSAPPPSRARSIARCWRRCSSRASASPRRARCEPAAPCTGRSAAPDWCPARRAATSSRGRRCRRPFVTRMSAFQARLATRRLTTLAARVRGRRAVAQRYSAWLAAHRVHAGVRARRRASTRSCATRCECANATPSSRTRDRRGVLLGDWFHSPLYPISGDLGRWGYPSRRASGGRAGGVRDRQPPDRRGARRTRRRGGRGAARGFGRADRLTAARRPGEVR